MANGPDNGGNFDFWMTIIVACVIAAVGGWWSCAAPCWMHGGTAVKDLPARCLK